MKKQSAPRRKKPVETAAPPYKSDEDSFPGIVTTPDGARSLFERDTTPRRQTLIKRKLWENGKPAPCPEFIAVQTLRQLHAKGVTGRSLANAERFAGDVVSEAIRNSDAPALDRMARSLDFLINEEAEKNAFRSTVEQLRALALSLTVELGHPPFKSYLRKKAGQTVWSGDDKEWRLLLNAAGLKGLPVDDKAKGNRRREVAGIR